MKKRGVEKTEVNLLDLVPLKNIRWEKTEEGLVVLLKPKFQHPFLRKHLLPRLKRPYFKVKLDTVGSFVWEQCDGKQTVQEIAQNLKGRFGEEVEPLYDRIALFLQSLEKNRFIYYEGFKT